MAFIEHRQLIILGAGPAGLSAAIYGAWGRVETSGDYWYGPLWAGISDPYH